MTLTPPEFSRQIKALFDRLNSPDDPAASMGPTIATAVMTGPQSSAAKWPSWTVISDEPKSVGGGETAPSPSSIFVAAIGFAENVIFARQAAMQGVDFDAMETRVEATWDRKGMFGIRDTDPAITDLFIETKILSNAPAEKLAELLRLTDKRSPLTATVAKSAKVHRRLLVNGTEIPV